MTPPIDTRFDLVTTLTDMAGVLLRRQRLWQVPTEGQIVNIEGNPYRVISVAWALPDLLDEAAAVVIGGRTY